MIKYRKVKCMIWNDNKFPFLDDDTQLVWFHAYTCPFSNGLGMFLASVEALAANKRWSVERYSKGFENLIANDFIRFDEGYQVVWFPKFLMHNKPENPNSLKGLLKFWSDIPESPLKTEFYHTLGALCNEWGDNFVKVFETLPKRYPKPIRNTETETETDTDTETENSPYQESKLININTSNSGGAF